MWESGLQRAHAGESVARKRTQVINTKLAGVSQANPDGTERQDLIKNLTMGEMVLLVRDHGNDHDLYATQVQAQSGEVIGLLPRQKTPQVGAWIDAGNLAIANVTSRGSAPGKDLVGVNIALVSEEDRPQVEADIRNRERWRRKELERLQPPIPGPAPKFQVTEEDGFPISMILLGVGLFLFMACGYTVCGG